MPQSIEAEITTDGKARFPRSDKVVWRARALVTFLAASDESGLEQGSTQALLSVLDRADFGTAQPGDLGSRKSAIAANRNAWDDETDGARRTGFARVVELGAGADTACLKRMEDRDFNEVDLRMMLAHAQGHRPDAVEGRWIIEARHQRRRWQIIVESDELERLLVVVTAYPMTR